MVFLVDGYNVTRSDPVTRELDLESQREALLARVRVRGRELLGAGPITVVFDGQGGVGVSRGDGAPVEARFSRDESADDLIVRLAAASREVTVVTSDNGLVTRLAGGARVLPREALYEGATGGRARLRSKRYPSRAAGLPAGANKVTEELKRLWLPDDKE